MLRKRLIWALFALAAGCGFGDKPYDQVDPASIPDSPTYNHDIAPRLDFYCTACHSEDSTLGVNAGWDFSAIGDVCSAVPTIVDAAFVERSMPPGGAERMQARDGAMLLKWLDVGCPQCNEDRDCPDERRCVSKPGNDPIPPLKLCSCRDNGDCTNQLCNSTSGLCVNCLSTADCSGGFKCNDDGNCVPCLADADCTDAGRTRCNLTSNRCVQCLGDADCSGGEKCNTSKNVCEVPI